MGFSKQRKKPGLRKSSNCVRNAFFQLSPSGRNEKTRLGSNFTISVSWHYFGWAFPSSGKSRVDESRPIAFKTRFFKLSPSGRNEKTPLGSNFTISVSCHHFGWAFPSSGKSRVDEGRPIAFKTWEASHAPSVVGQSGGRKSASSSSSSSSSSSLSCRVDVDVVPSGLHIAPALGFFFFIGTLQSVSRSFFSRSVVRPSTIPTSLVLPPSFRAKTKNERAPRREATSVVELWRSPKKRDASLPHLRRPLRSGGAVRPR